MIFGRGSILLILPHRGLVLSKFINELRGISDVIWVKINNLCSLLVAVVALLLGYAIFTRDLNLKFI